MKGHGHDETKWPAEAGGGKVVKDYAERVKMLGETNRRFILEDALPQGAGREARGVVGRMMEER